MLCTQGLLSMIRRGKLDSSTTLNADCGVAARGNGHLVKLSRSAPSRGLGGMVCMASSTLERTGEIENMSSLFALIYS